MNSVFFFVIFWPPPPPESHGQLVSQLSVHLRLMHPVRIVLIHSFIFAAGRIIPITSFILQGAFVLSSIGWGT